MFDQSVHNINLSEIDFENKKFIVTHNPESEVLIESIKSSGVVQPVVLKPSQGKYQIVSGYRRCFCAEKAGLKSVPGVFLDRDTEDRVCFLLSIHSNASVSNFNEVEKAEIVYKSEKEFALSINEKRIIYLIAGIPDSDRIRDVYLKLRDIDGNSKEQAVFLGVNLSCLEKMLKFGIDETAELLNLFSAIRANNGAMKKFLDMFLEVKIRDGDEKYMQLFESVSDVALQKGVNGTAEIEEKLLSVRYPLFSEQKRLCGELVSEMKLPPDIRIGLPENYENEDVKLNLLFRSEKELGSYLDKLKNLLSDGKIKKLFDSI